MTELTTAPSGAPLADGDILLVRKAGTPGVTKVTAAEAADYFGTAGEGGGGGGSGGGSATARASGKRWQIRFIAGRYGHQAMGFCDIQFQDASGTNLCVGGAPYTDREEGGVWALAEAFDGTVSTNDNGYFSGDTVNALGCVVGYAFPAAVAPAKVRLQHLQTCNWSLPNRVAIECVGDDGIVILSQIVDMQTIAPADATFYTFPIDDILVARDGSGGSGGGGIALPGLFDQIAAMRASTLDNAFTGGKKFDKIATYGDLNALLLDIYASGSTSFGSPVVADTARVTVPAGKIAVLVYHAKSDNCRDYSNHYKHWVRNITTNTDFGLYPYANTEHLHGWVTPDAANDSHQWPLKIGVAGDTIAVCASSSGDGNSRIITGFAIVAFADATTGEVELPTGSGGSGGGSGGGAPFSGARVTLTAIRNVPSGETDYFVGATTRVDFDNGGWWNAAQGCFVIPAGVTRVFASHFLGATAATGKGNRLYRKRAGSPDMAIAFGGDDTDAFKTVSAVVDVVAGDRIVPAIYTGYGDHCDADLCSVSIMDVTASGGGSSGGGDWAFDPPTAASVTAFSGDGTAATLTDDADIGLIIDTGANNNDGPYRGITVPVPASGAQQLTVRFNFTGSPSHHTAPAFGVLGDGDTRGRALWLYKNSNGYNMVRWRQGTAGQNGGNDGDIDFWHPLQPHAWLRVVVNADNSVSWYRSSNGKTWQLLLNASSDTTGRPDKFMAAVRIASNDGQHSYLTIDHLEVLAL